ncbi:MAG TPA: APC family permease [Spirochaetia bacterium]|nr:APC family permease [Spirochaetia bacterium]
MPELKRVLTLRTVVATSAGLTLATSSFVAAAQVASMVLGDSAWLAILVGGLMCFAAAACFSELNGLYPSAAGIRLYFARAFSDKMGLTTAILYMAVIMSVFGVESYVLAAALSQVLPGIPPLIWVVGMLAVVCVLNIRGVKLAGGFQDAITYALIISLVVLAVIALGRVGFHLHTPLSPGPAGGFVQAVAVGIFLYIGFEWVTPLAEEVTKIPQISRGMMLALGMLSVVYALFTMAMSSYLPHSVLAHSAAPQILFARRVFGLGGALWMVVLSVGASITTFNAGLIGISRFAYASARELALPPFLARVSRYFTPWAAVVTVCVLGLAVAATVLLTGRYLVLVDLGAAVESLVYALTGLAVLSLRRREPDKERPYLAGRSRLIPLVTTVIFFGLALSVFLTDQMALLYLLSGLLICFLYVTYGVPALRRRYGRRPTRSRRPAPGANVPENR